MARMKPAILLLVIMLVLATAVGCGGGGGTEQGENGDDPGETQAQDPPEEEESTPSGEVKVSVTPPEGWKPVDGSVALAHYQTDGGATFMITRDSVSSAGGNLDDYMKLAKEQLESMLGEVTITEEEATKIHGYDARKFTLIYTNKMLELQMKMMLIYVFRDGYAYTINCAAASARGTGFEGVLDDFDDLEGDFQQFLDSFKFE